MKTKRGFKVSNIWTNYRSSIVGAIIAIAIYSLVYPLKVATFSDVSPLLLIVIPFLLYGKKPPSIGA